MELFEHRKLALGCLAFLASLFVSFYLHIAVKIAILSVSGIAIFVLTYKFWKRRTRKFKRRLFTCVPVFLFIILAMTVSMCVYDRDKSSKEFFHSEIEHEFIATIEDTVANNTYKATVHIIDGEDYNTAFTIKAYGYSLKSGDVILGSGIFSPFTSDKIGFDRGGYYLSLGEMGQIKASAYRVIDRKSTVFFDTLSSINHFLDKRLSQIDDKLTYEMLSALILGNKSALPKEVSLDFTRIGLSHALALSGMHITILITLLGFLLDKSFLNEYLKSFIIIVFTFLFVGITGFSDSALRAGGMVILSYLLFFIARRIDLLTSLTVSVVIMCLIDPYNIFSVSLILSFSAMLGCLVASRLIRKAKLYRVIRVKAVRFLIYSLISSSVALAFTLPCIFIVFGQVAVLSLVTNIFLSPLFAALIYLAPIYLIIGNSFFLSDIISELCKLLTHILVDIAKLISQLEGIVLPIQSYIQVAGIILLCLYLVFLLLSRKGQMKRAICGMLAGVFLFILGYGLLIVDRHSDTYVSVYATEYGDVLSVENDNSISVIDISLPTSLSSTDAYNTVNYLGYAEIENYIMLDLSQNSLVRFSSLLGSAIVQNVIIPSPKTTEERLVWEGIRESAEERGCCACALSSSFNIGDTDITLDTAENPLVFIQGEKTALIYSSPTSFENQTENTSRMFQHSDIAIFGTYGDTVLDYSNLSEYDISCYSILDDYFIEDTPIIKPLSGAKELLFEGYPIRLILK